jgi:hypothetical protein
VVATGGGAAGFFAAGFHFRIIGFCDNGLGLPRSNPYYT